MFKYTPDGHTHHDKDACYKCKKCGGHFFSERTREVHDCWISVENENYDRARDNKDLSNM